MARIAGGRERVIAVDWSGARDPRRTLWLAEHDATGLTRLTNGFTHDTIRDELSTLVRAHHAQRVPLTLGLDFAFGFPARFAARHGVSQAADVWALADAHGDAWCRCDEAPFWGRAGLRATRADGWGGPRATDVLVRSLGLGAPKSPYQVTGAGAVGSSTIRGMPVLRVLRALGAAIWPFDAPSTVTVIECYPRIATGRDVVKRDPAARTAWLRRHRDLTAAHRRAAQDSDDAFDALAAARWLWRHRDAIARSPRAVDDAQRIEGAIWVPPSLLPTPGAA